MKYRKKVFSVGKTGYVKVGPVKAGPLGVGCLLPSASVFLLALVGLIVVVL